MGERLKDEILNMSKTALEKMVANYYPEADIAGLKDEVQRNFLIILNVTPDQFQNYGEVGMVDEIMKLVEDNYKRKEDKYGTELISQIERFAMLSVIDEKWKEHLREMDDLKEGINFRAYGQKDPLIEYKKDGFELFVKMIEDISREVINFIFKFTTREEQQQIPQRRRPLHTQNLQTIHASAQGAGFNVNPEEGQDAPQNAGGVKKTPIKVAPKVGRNDPCPCGSGKKYKNCHGQ
jgi:preprotein translocase subunit SecA